MSYSLFEAFGVEIEYMIVDAATLDVSATADRLLERVAGEVVSEIELGDIAWSNELMLHVLELKTNGPTSSLAGLSQKFHEHVLKANSALAEWNARLMPTAMHPWMDPLKDSQLWPHEYTAIYHAYDRIFGCQGHGWANLQSVHLNLPFSNDEEFGRLHAAIRLLLPLIPALAASSPIADGQLKPALDYRLEVYRTNSAKIPSLTGHVVPECVYTESDYEQQIFQRLYRDISPFDPDGILQHPFLNSRGAIARFDRGAIEIRVVDSQECPAADLAIVAFEVEVLKALVAERWSAFAAQSVLDTEELSRLLFSVVRDGEQTVISHRQYLEQFGVTATSMRAGELCEMLIEELQLNQSAWQRELEVLVSQGPLARRIRNRLQGGSAADVTSVYRELCDCLSENRTFA